MTSSASNLLLIKLQAVFKLPDFRPNQRTICEAIMAGKPTLAILPTGGGKSLCYQLPAVCLPGLTIVVSPLLSLINDQVGKLIKLGVRAAALTSQQTTSQKNDVVMQLQANELKLLYVSPEQLQVEKWQRILATCHLSCVVVDEAHCLAEWGNDFRPAYLNIGSFVASLPKLPPIAAFTATATPATIDVITQSLGLKNPLIIKQTAVRKNLQVIIHRCQSSNEKITVLISYLVRKNLAPAIIYCATRSDTEIVANWLKDKASVFSNRLPTNIAAYHAGLKSEQRQQIEKKFLHNDIDVLVATTAFGMGVDKANTRLVIHWQVPNSIENFCQEIGRAGRDQQPATSVLLFRDEDLLVHKTLVAHLQTEHPTTYQQKINKLSTMKYLATTNRCINRVIDDYFGENNPGQHCNRCSSCIDVSYLAIHEQKIFQSLWRKTAGHHSPPILKAAMLWLILLQPTTISQLAHVPGWGSGLVKNYGEKIITHVAALIADCPQTDLV